ncbi:DUF4355 domain-containing protein [Clostridium pasteurianum]|uniref:DUF4355 domain-containing protein n=1 Tax=Clostridium pasteurianum TaxID=1501 RepID=UPI002260BCB6|nr:DUF4355 domain-containing protein [Clostridium pasteurianum]UZW14331.1 DUF4355 domain-containing protein [Clostridium pasteurianum]
MENENVQANETTEVKTEETKTEVKTFTEEEVQKLLNSKIQSETDKVRQNLYKEKIKPLEDELVKLKPVDKSESEIELENRLKVLEDKEKEIQAKERLIKVSETLKDNGLNSQLAKYINLQGVEDLESYTKELAGVLQKHITDSQINNSYKPSNHTGNKDVISKDDFIKMSYADRVNLFKSNEELYKRLSK